MTKLFMHTNLKPFLKKIGERRGKLLRGWIVAAEKYNGDLFEIALLELGSKTVDKSTKRYQPIRECDRFTLERFRRIPDIIIIRIYKRNVVPLGYSLNRIDLLIGDKDVCIFVDCNGKTKACRARSGKNFEKIDIKKITGFAAGSEKYTQVKEKIEELSDIDVKMNAPEEVDEEKRNVKSIKL